MIDNNRDILFAEFLWPLIQSFSCLTLGKGPSQPEDLVQCSRWEYFPCQCQDAKHLSGVRIHDSLHNHKRSWAYTQANKNKEIWHFNASVITVMSSQEFLKVFKGRTLWVYWAKETIWQEPMRQVSNILESRWWPVNIEYSKYTVRSIDLGPSCRLESGQGWWWAVDIWTRDVTYPRRAECNRPGLRFYQPYNLNNRKVRENQSSNLPLPNIKNIYWTIQFTLGWTIAEPPELPKSCVHRKFFWTLAGSRHKYYKR